MAWKRVVTEMGMGTDIRGGDSTKAAVRALPGRTVVQLAECHAGPGDGRGFDARRGDYRRAAARGS